MDGQPSSGKILATVLQEAAAFPMTKQLGEDWGISPDSSHHTPKLRAQGPKKTLLSPPGDCTSHLGKDCPSWSEWQMQPTGPLCQSHSLPLYARAARAPSSIGRKLTADESSLPGKTTSTSAVFVLE